jgi:integrase
MSVFKRKGQTVYSYDFQLQGDRFTGSCETASRKEAEKIEADAKKKAEADILEKRRLGFAPLTFKLASERYYAEVGQHHAAPLTTINNLLRLEDFFGATKRLDEITDNDIAQLVAWARARRVGGKRKGAVISPTTVNRSFIEPLQKLFNRAKLFWGVSFAREPRWRVHKLKEPTERVREVRPVEEAMIAEAIRPDYLPLVNFARASGLRLAECLLRKEQVDLVGGRIETIGKGGKTIRLPITAEMRAILMQEMANPTDHVFTYAAQRPQRDKDGRACVGRGDRVPITIAGLKTIWKRAKGRKKGTALPRDLRFHDLRHDFGTKLLRETGNLKLVQRALNHSDVKTTSKYAHVLDEDLLAGMEAASGQRKSK